MVGDWERARPADWVGWAVQANRAGLVGRVGWAVQANRAGLVGSAVPARPLLLQADLQARRD